jgi:hypothetical protein
LGGAVLDNPAHWYNLNAHASDDHLIKVQP